ncbi:zinc finger protein 431-like [Achroia grisella]|uniref:zinc finger protein 431-like n=1 Tax=Achroia grisella TaxID=688607 RepID=UPI0027D29436|nr:zinc finger protein 431-like [Achroia grisella]XP_059056427.1 zinc finger protein 431-like [Achroia grisella]XP_059056428.1 zinc finger protein 431-like [Achroia grisella]
MDSENVCRCCLSGGASKDLNSTYVWSNKKEIYSDMLLECFNVVLSMSEYSGRAICDGCIELLRSSFDFKQQVLRSEKELLNRLIDVDDQKPVAIKLEPKQDSGDDSDDYFLADAVREATEQKIKCEVRESKKKSEQKRKKPIKKAVKKTGEKWRTEKIKSLVNRLATSLNTCDIPDIPLKNETNVKANRTKISISKEPMYKETKINLMWTTRTNHDKSKHKENLQTILKFSNATPFKNKSLLGFICGYCDATYPDPMDLRTHTEVDHKIERLQFKSNFDMTEYNVKLDITDLACNLCDEQMCNLTSLKDHLVKSHDKIIYNDIKDHILQFKLKKGDVYDCAMCSSTYETFKMLKQHMNKHYCNYTCPKCDSSFATKRSLNAHRTTHQEGSFKCDHCEKVFSSRSKKHYHEKTKHMGARNISNCPYCNEPFRSYYQRNQHLVKVHNNEAQYKCNVCNKSYILKSLLMYHIKKNHLMERNCQCTECGFRFFSKKALKAHMIKHTGERIYACEVCHKSYARKYTLREHMRIHNNDRRFKCDVCAMAFVQKCSLKSHLLSNHGISMAASDITSS